MTTSRRDFLETAILSTLASTWALSRRPLAAGQDRETDPPVVDRALTAAAQRAELSMLFRGETAKECRAWQRAFRAKLSGLLGDSSPPREWRAREVERKGLGDHTRYQLLLEARNVPAVPVYLLAPPGASRETPAPAVLCIHGHGDHGHHPVVGRRDLEGVAGAIDRAHYDYGLQFVRRGYVVAAPCMIPFGDRVERERYGGNDPCAVTFVRMQALGQLAITANLRDLRWTIDLLESRPEVARGKIGCAGLSYGGRMTMLVTAMDERIRVAAVSGALNLLQERITRRYSCGLQIIPGLLRYGDFSEIGSLIAPRPCVWEVGSRDGLIRPEFARVFRQRLERAYRALGAIDDLRFDDFEGGHRWNGKIAYPLFHGALRE